MLSLERETQKLRIMTDKYTTSITYIAMRCNQKIKNRVLITGRIICRAETKLVTQTQPNYLFDSPKLKKQNFQTKKQKMLKSDFRLGSARQKHSDNSPQLDVSKRESRKRMENTLRRLIDLVNSLPDSIEKQMTFWRSLQ